MSGSGTDSPPRRILPVIVFAQFAGTSLWFAGNAILRDLGEHWNIPAGAVGDVTSSVQLGFIVGTLFVAITGIADRNSPRLIFLASSILGAACNLALFFLPHTLFSLLIARFATGLMLAGIYPVGMKIASGWYRGGLGNALGFLVGALVLGTSLPHFLRSLTFAFRWEDVVWAVSALAASGGVAMAWLVPDGPHLATANAFSGSSLASIFRNRDLRPAMFGYFGHMWELYTLYAFVPVMLTIYQGTHPSYDINISLSSFFIIGAGSIGCIGGGMLSARFGSARVAVVQLAASGILCLASPLLFSLPGDLFLCGMIIWGIVVVGDSPQYSTLVARRAPAELVGSALTITNSIGFAITIVSIQFTKYFSATLPDAFILFPLFVGPLAGLLSMRSLLLRRPEPVG